MSLLFALLAALSNAANVITQHVASTSAPGESKGWRFVWYLVSNPLWLFGGAALIGAFVFQAIALHLGSLSIVQTLLMTELVFSLVLRRLWIKQSISFQAWTAAVVTCAAVSIFIATAEPQGGHTAANSGDWTVTIIACAAAAGALALLGTRGSPSRRAALLAVSSSVIWALEATFIKTMTDTLTEVGIGRSFLHWPLYAVAIGGIIGTLLTQAALHVGPLRVSQPLLVIVDPMVSILLSVYLFGEHFTLNAGYLTLASLSFTILCGGVFWLTRAAPETVKRDL